MCASDVETCMALVTRDASAFARLTKFANLVVSKCWRTNAFYNFESLCITKFCLGNPDSAVYMNPVIIGSSLERFARHLRTAFISLCLAVLIFDLIDEFFFQSLFFPLSIGFLLV